MQNEVSQFFGGAEGCFFSVEKIFILCFNLKSTIFLQTFKKCAIEFKLKFLKTYEKRCLVI